MLFDVYLSLEIYTVPQFHEFVGVARVAIFAGEFTAAIGIDGPGKGHSGHRATVEQRANRQGEVFHVVSLPKGLALGGQTRNPDQSRTWRLR